MVTCISVKEFGDLMLSMVSLGLINKGKVLGFPGGSVVKDPAANARDMGFDPWSRKIPYTAEQLSPFATIIEPALCDKRSRPSEKPVRWS